MKRQLTFLSLVFLLSPLYALPPSDVLFVALGGYTSCGKAGPKSIGMHDSFFEMLEKVQKARPEIKMHYLVACLGDVAPPKGEGQYFTSANPETQYGDTAKIRDEIETLSKLAKEMPVYIMGHSYGGWMSMYLSSQLSPAVKISGLITLDPISNKCGPMQFITGAAACKQAPKDLKNPAILARVQYWENFYQTQDNWLHSSSIPEAINHLMQYRGPHSEVDSDPRVWEIITNAISSKLN